MKTALCFLISYEHILNKEQLWIDWIKPNQDIINVYFHYKDINQRGQQIWNESPLGFLQDCMEVYYNYDTI
jgi:protoheme ferro-lyase